VKTGSNGFQRKLKEKEKKRIAQHWSLLNTSLTTPPIGPLVWEQPTMGINVPLNPRVGQDKGPRTWLQRSGAIDFENFSTCECYS
jgi:hypothetical protein